MNAEESDGQWRGMFEGQGRPNAIHIGNYAISDFGDGQLLIANKITGELGAFRKDEFEAYVAAFFGLNF